MILQNGEECAVTNKLPLRLREQLESDVPQGLPLLKNVANFQ